MACGALLVTLAASFASWSAPQLSGFIAEQLASRVLIGAEGLLSELRAGAADRGSDARAEQAGRGAGGLQVAASLAEAGALAGWMDGEGSAAAEAAVPDLPRALLSQLLGNEAKVKTQASGTGEVAAAVESTRGGCGGVAAAAVRLAGAAAAAALPAAFAAAPPLWFCVLCPSLLGLALPLIINELLNQVG
jgi:hypothetical protein